MALGTSLLLITVGAILKYAVTANVEGIDIHTAGLVLMIVGIAGLAISLFLLVRAGSERVPPPEWP
jgi:hypothetical protein